jgi:hypothetical protein
MSIRRRTLLVSAIAISSALWASHAWAQNRSSDEYTRYELLEPGSGKFRIIYDVTAVTPGATAYYNPIRKGSEASDESVIDLMTREPLKFEVVTGAQAREGGFARADLDTSYIKVTLARPVPPNGGEGRIRILKTYKDAKSYYTEGDTIVFARPLGIRRNSVILPPGYEIVSCNVPVQVIEEPDARIGVSFIHTFPGEADLVLKARRTESLAKRAADAARSPIPTPVAGGVVGSPLGPLPGQAAPEPRRLADSNVVDMRVSERARQDREIVYFMQPPETHSFRLYHDYTETREGVDQYVNIVRAGSKSANPSAMILDTGEKLKTETLTGADLKRAIHGNIGEPIEHDTEGVVISFPPVQKGRSVRLRIEETYSDPGRYGLLGEQLIWHRAFGRPANAVLLPEGWYLTVSAVPATISQEDGKTRLDFVNPRNDEIDTYIKARRR